MSIAEAPTAGPTHLDLPETDEAERLRAEKLAARLRELGVDPDSV